MFFRKKPLGCWQLNYGFDHQLETQVIPMVLWMEKTGRCVFDGPTEKTWCWRFNSKLRYGWCGTSYHATCNGPTHQPAFGSSNSTPFTWNVFVNARITGEKKGGCNLRGDVWMYVYITMYYIYLSIYIYIHWLLHYMTTIGKMDGTWTFFKQRWDIETQIPLRVEDVKPQTFNLLEVKEKGRIQLYETLKLENFIRWCPSLGSQHTVDGSEIPWPTTVWMCKTPVNHGIFTTYQPVSRISSINSISFIPESWGFVQHVLWVTLPRWLIGGHNTIHYHGLSPFFGGVGQNNRSPETKKICLEKKMPSLKLT